MKIGDKVDVLHEGLEFEGTVYEVKGDTISVTDHRGVKYQTLSPLAKGAIRGFKQKPQPHKAPAQEKAPDKSPD